MMKRSIIFVFVYALGIEQSVSAVTIVYNMRVASPTSAREEVYETLDRKLPSVVVLNYTQQSRTVRNGNEQMVYVGLAEYIYSFDTFYIRGDTAGGRVHEDIKIGGSTTHTQLDDIVLYAGYRHKAQQSLHLAYSLLFGIPTHKDHGFEYFQLGTGHFSIGAQIDGIYNFGVCGTHNLIMALRFVHFFKAKTMVPLPTRRLCIDFDLGNVCDLFIAYQKKVQKHYFEFGYNPSFAFNVSSKPSLGDVLPSSGIRNTWYSAYRYIFITKKHPMGFSLGLSYGFDYGDHVIGLKRVITFWGSYGINF